MNYGVTIAASLAIPLAGALAIALSGRINDNLRESVTLITAGALALAVWSLVPDLMAGARPELQLFEVVPGIELGFRIEPLGMLFAALAAGLWIVNSVYSIGRAKDNDIKKVMNFSI